MLFVVLDVRRESPVRINLAFIGVALFGIPFLFAIIPLALGFAHNAHVATLDRLAEKIIRAHLDIGVL